jgi:hypothetical protein
MLDPQTEQGVAGFKQDLHELLSLGSSHLRVMSWLQDHHLNLLCVQQLWKLDEVQ